KESQKVKMMVTKGETAVSAHSTDSVIFQKLAEETPNGIIVFQGEKVQFVNAPASQILGYSRRTISRWTKKNFIGRVMEEDCPKVLWFFDKLSETQSPPIEIEIRLLQRKRQIRWARIIGNIVEVDNQSILLMNLVDVTERKQAEEVIRQTHAEIVTIFNTISDGMQVIDTDYNVIRVNKALAALSGMREEDIVGRKCYDYFQGPECHTDACILRRVLSGWEHIEEEVEKQSQDGSSIPCSLIVTALRSEDGELLGIIKVFRDIRERKRTEAALKASRERFRTIVEDTADWIWEVDAQGIFTYSNHAVEDILGRTVGQILGLSLFDFLVEDEVDSVRLQFQEDIAAKRGFHSLVNQWVHAWDPKSVFLEASGRPILNEDGEAVGFRGICRDITERIEAYTTLRVSEANYRALIKTSPDAITVTDLEGVILIASQQTAKMHGFDHEGELIGKSALDLIIAEQHSEIKATLKDTLVKGIHQNLEFTFVRKNHSTFPGKLSVSVLMSADGKPMGFIYVSRDITEIKEAEEDILEARARAEFFNDLMTHDLTNINQAILLSLELSLQEPDLPEQLQKQLQFSLQQVERSAALISRVKDFLRIDTEPALLEPESLTAAFSDALAAVRQVFPNKSIRVESTILKGKHIVMADDFLIDLLFHLLSNAVRFDHRQRIVIDVDVTPVFEEDFLKLEVKDRGPGVPDEIKELVFTRYTPQLHEKTKGRGIELTIIRRLITRYKGKIWVEDRVLGDHSQGANFVILLPRAKQPSGGSTPSY
ncbi:MAG: PAS domain S-box protein, partial [Promethearchaeota archaeon]